MSEPIKIPMSSTEYAARFDRPDVGLIATDEPRDEQPRTYRDLVEQLRTLQQHYVILGGDRPMIEFLEQKPALFSLLIEAVRPLQRAFGEERVFHVRMLHSDDDSLLKVAVRLPADFDDDAEAALRSFDLDWWLGCCHRSGGALVFDYEIQDAV